MSSKSLSIFREHLWSQAKQPAWSVDARTATGLLLCIVLLSLGGWLYLTQASQIATVSAQMSQTVRNIEKLERENALLRYQIAQMETIPRIEARAKQLGLQPMYNQTTYLTVPESLAEPEVFPMMVQAASLSPESQAPVVEPEPNSTFSLPEIWSEVKTLFESWVGQ